MKRGCGILFILLMLVVLCIGVAFVGYVLFSSAPSKPAVLIYSPHAGESVAVGQEAIIHAVARDDTKVKRVEVWVNGELRDAQNSSVPGGTSPFPIVVNWRPQNPGTQTLVVRAYNAQNNRGSATINLNVIQSGDRDNDGTPDSLDECADQPGLASGNGCPAPTTGDRDGDGVLDESDACADQVGSLSAEGCPDADNDRVRDSADACPREFGLPERNGCPNPGDADGDGGVDSADECPREPGPGSTRGCPDVDGDGVRDRDDACPSQAGVPGLGGCPDRDGDGVRDAQDLCPDAAGPASNSGCPASSAGDRDGDGVRDDTDLAPDEPGRADSGGAPPPGGGADRDSDGVADSEEPPGGMFGIPPLFFGPVYSLTFVEFQALEFTASAEFDRVYCYAGLENQMDRYGPFDALGTYRWDIAEYLGGANSRRVGLASGQPLRVRAECYGERRSPFGGWMARPFDLGSFDVQHPASDWNGNPITTRSTPTADGRSFGVKYRICTGSCTPMAFQPPEISMRILYRPSPTRVYMDWRWTGDWAMLGGYRLYRNGNLVWNIARNANSAEITSLEPPCGETHEFYMTAVDAQTGRESAPSGRMRWTGGEWETLQTCSRTVRVTFLTLDTHLPGPPPPGPYPSVGPIRGSFWVNAQRVDFNTNNRVRPEHAYPVANLLTRDNSFTIELANDQDLTIGGTIIDKDSIGRDDTLFSAEHTFRASDPLPQQYVLSNRLMKLVVRIEALSTP